jgi:Flp pilus assembly pilin Flp
MARLLERPAADEGGATMVEYAPMVALIGAAPATTIGDRLILVSNTIAGP